jgi:integral membrane protein
MIAIGPYFRANMENSTMDKGLKRFIWISRAEGISFLLLLGIAMPLKYAFAMPLAVKYVGWAHGILFIAYIIQLLIVGIKLKWDELRILFGGIAALLPFGPFVFERSLKRNSKSE